MENTDIIYLIAFASYILVCMYRCGRRRQWDFNCFRLLTRHNSQEEDDLLHASIRNGLTGTFEQYQVNISRLALEEADPEARREFVMGRIVVKKVESFHDLRHVDDSTSSSPTCIDITNSINTGLSISIDDHLHHHRDEDGTGGSVVEKDKCHPQNDLDEESNSPTSLEQNKTLDRDDNDTSDHAGGDDQEDENDAKISQSLKSIFSSLKSSVFENESEDDDDELYNNNNNKNKSPNDHDDVKLCAICLNEYEVGQSICQSKNKECQHTFHYDCMIEWLMRHDECPLCRKDFLKHSDSDADDVEAGVGIDGDGDGSDNDSAILMSQQQLDDIIKVTSSLKYLLLLFKWEIVKTLCWS